MAEIQLSQGRVALVDDSDYRRVVGGGGWYAYRAGRTFYARRNETRDGRRVTVMLHRVLTGWPKTDHINGDGLDNRRVNLRPATTAQNARNARLRKDNSSGYKGVRLDNGKWLARIGANWHLHYIGRFNSAIDAARAYDAAATELFGEFARLNFPGESA